MRKQIVLALVLLGSLTLAGAAHAEYVCWSTYKPLSTTTYGDYGYIYASFWTGPGCTGSQSGSSKYYCTKNATSSSCATAANCNGNDYTYTEQGILTLAQMLRGAAQSNQSLYPDGLCGTGRGSFVTFQAD